MDLFDQPAPSSVLSVGELTLRIKEVLESSFGLVEVSGEVSQPKTSRNNHIYFTLKDQDAQLPCVLWGSRADALEMPLTHGDQVVAVGQIQLYAPHGRYQMVVHSVRQAGLGALQLAFERLKQKLQAEGLFDADRKRPLPRFPRRIGVVTSPTGAAFQDIRTTLEKRYPLCEVWLYPAAVQGRQAASEVARGIAFFSESQSVDVVITGRGGGSLEDLQAFNEEIVARAVAACRVPVISAVGHETDMSICDFVADVRAATPTQAAVLAVPDKHDLLMRLDELQGTLEGLITSRLQTHRDTINRFLDNYALHKVAGRIHRLSEQLTWQEQRMHQLAARRLERGQTLIERTRQQLDHRISGLLLERRSRWNELRHRLEATDPDAPLKKGYTRIRQQGTWVRRAAGFDQRLAFEIQWSDGVRKSGE